MPPQQLSRLYPNCGVSLTPERAIERPEVCAQIANCITCWAWVETQVSRLFVLLSQQNTEAAVALYNLFGGASLKENSLRVLAITNCPNDYKIIEALIQVVRSEGKNRDKICHWVWGISEQIPDGLILVDPKFLLIQQARQADIDRAGKHPALDDVRIPDKELYVYRVKDLQADAKTFTELALLVNKSHGLVVRTGEQLDQLRDELLKDVRIQERLSPKASGGR